MSKEMDYNDCKNSEDHYWVKSDDMESHCRRKPNQD